MQGSFDTRGSICLISLSSWMSQSWNWAATPEGPHLAHFLAPVSTRGTETIELIDNFYVTCLKQKLVANGQMMANVLTWLIGPSLKSTVDFYIFLLIFNNHQPLSDFDNAKFSLERRSFVIVAKRQIGSN